MNMNNMYVSLPNGKKLRFPTDEEDAAITAAAMSDPDALPWTDEEWEAVKPFARIGLRPRAGRPPVEVPKPRMSMQVDADILSALRATGKDWQMRANALLREAVATGKV